MNSLSDLRSTLDEHADRVADGETVVRAAAVQHRVSVVRRRRRSVGAGALVVALVAVGGVAVSHRGHSESMPSAPTVLGVQAPTTFQSLGYTYRTDGSSATLVGRGSIDIPRSTWPRLVSWTTDHPATVRLKLPDGQYWTSTESRFHDFVVVPPGDGGTLQVSTTAGQVGLATYDVTNPPEGQPTGNPGEFRREVAGATLVGGLQAQGRHLDDWSRFFYHPHGQVKVSVLCTGAPAGSIIHVAVRGSELQSGCDTSAFDPGSNVIGSTSLGRSGRNGRFRTWVTAPGSSRPLDVAERGDVSMGAALYGFGRGERVAGMSMDRTVEYGGHTWRLSRVQRSATTPIRFRVGGQPSVLQVDLRMGAGARTDLGVQVSGLPVIQSGFSGAGSGGTGPLWAPAGAQVRITRSTPGLFGVGIYTLADADPSRGGANAP